MVDVRARNTTFAYKHYTGDKIILHFVIICCTTSPMILINGEIVYCNHVRTDQTTKLSLSRMSCNRPLYTVTIIIYRRRRRPN